MKLLEENTGIKKALNMGLVSDFSLWPLEHKKQNTSQWDYFKIKKLLHTKRSHQQSEKTKNGKIYKENLYVNNLLQLNSEKQITQILKWTKDQNRSFSKETIQKANRCMKRCSTSLVFAVVVQSPNRVWLFTTPWTHTRPACPSQSPGVCPSSCSLHRWCRPAISSSDALLVVTAGK